MLTREKDGRGVLACLKVAWGEAQALSKHAFERRAQGLDDVATEDKPLQAEVQKATEERFETYYHWSIDPSCFGDDVLLAKVVQEFQRSKPRMYPASKVKTVSRSNQVGQPQRERVGKGRLVYEEEDTLLPEPDSNRLRYRLQQYEVLANTWAVGGSFLTGEGDRAAPFCHWQDARFYVARLRSKVEPLTDRYTEDSVLSYLEKVEEELRGKVIGEVRRRVDPIAWGPALRWAIKEHSEVWQDHRDVLQRLPGQRAWSKGGGARGSGDGPPRQPPPRPPVPRRSRSRSLRREPPANPKFYPLGDYRRAQTASHLETTGKGRVRFCSAWLQGRCQDRCPKGDIHACNLVLAKSRRPCGQRHKPANHDEKTHGYLQPA